MNLDCCEFRQNCTTHLGWISTVAQFVRKYTSTQVNFTSVNKIEAMYERPRVNVKVEGSSSSTFTRDTPYITPILFTHVKCTCA